MSHASKGQSKHTSHLRKMGRRSIAVSGCVFLISLSLFKSKQDPVQAQVTPVAKVEFARDIRPIFNKNCVACHGGIKQASGLSFILREKILQPADSGEIPVVPGDPDHSELIRKITSKDAGDRMPPPERGPALSEHEIALLRQWIKEGAKWEEHWAYVSPRAQPLPEVSNASWCLQPLDRFVLARLDKEQLKPSAPAERTQWLRRVSFDLTGLPPTTGDTKAFLDDQRPDSFERVVDRLLDSSAFGERWASIWLDLSRYADTMGFERDATRTVWPYRDWLIRAFNSDMSYDQFIIRQLAGDLLPDATIDDRVATVFHRNTQTNAEGGTDDEEFRVAAVVDRVNTTWEAMQGVTFRCAQCHSHPYDPIQHTDFYRFLGIFNSTRDWDLKSETPVLRVPLNRSDDQHAQELDRQIASAERDEAEQVRRVALTVEKDWQPLHPAHAASTKSTKLEIHKTGDLTDVVTSGTVSHGSRFTIDIPVPPSVGRVTAIRVEGLPKDIAAARLTPELGFVISQLRMSVIPPNVMPATQPEPEVVEANSSTAPSTQLSEAELQQQAAEAERRTAAQEAAIVLPGTELRFSHVFGDEMEPFQDPEGSLNRDAAGWGALPRIDRPRHAEFVLDEPVDLPAGGTLRLVMTFNNAAGDDMPQVMNRGRFSISSSQQWTDLIHEQSFTDRRSQIAAVRQQRQSITAVAVPVMKEQDPGQARVTAMFVRGNWLDKGDVVLPGVPKMFGQLPSDAPSDRLALAKWMASPDDPLTARVAVNRLWEQLFGTGLVETLEDFGSSGLPPSHPELLDYLALRFRNELGWSTKKMLREFVLSATYRQDAMVRPDLLQKDPRNRLLARGPRTRLTAEMVRDQALAVSGLLSGKMFGPPVMPQQPDGIWRSVYNQSRWQTSQGEDRYRRGVYTFWKRTAGYPAAAMFDAPSREVCTARRISTNTPLQALVTMNDPVYMECAQALVNRLNVESPNDPAAQIARAWQLATGKIPDDADAKLLLSLYERSLDKYAKDSTASGKLADSPQHAAMVVVANAILNLDVVMTK